MSRQLRGPALLFCPGDRPGRFAEAADRADTVILDLEDAVAPEAKEEARSHVADALPGLDPARVLVRINPVATPWWRDDLAALPDGLPVLLPKASSPEEVRACGERPVVALCETAAGVLAAGATAREPTCAGPMWGGEDLVADLGGRSSRGSDGAYRSVAAHARAQVLLAAGAAGVPALDTVHLDIPDVEGLRRESEAAAAEGFRAKACIHPSHVPVIRAAFAPSRDEVAWARAVLEAARSQGAVFRHEGRMVDAPVLAHARRVVGAEEPEEPEPPR
ncbi:HpcH/HpaI aldolase/citrate lyase family protein [Streptomyces sulphureus]|uniref:HpcH/HpaI aldolase/citrate lyase family protein n=1 Tax=Streptomyces sulphureus TaxID=47758 RepID=UPI0003790D0C|nr:aldolase/citrate lyase family protein [Streptomyces sulphureus]